MKSLHKALDVLELFIESEEEVDLSELAKKSGYDKTTVNRITSCLIKRGYLKQKVKRGKYSLGMKFLDYSGVIKKRSNIRTKAMPYLIKLARHTKESIILTILDGQFAAYNEIIPSEKAHKIVPDEGTRVPLYCTGVGKIFLSAMTDKEFDEYIRLANLETHTEKTISQPEYLKAHIDIVAKEGIAYEYDEYFIGIANVATGIRDSDGKIVAAVGVLGPSLRLTLRQMKEFVPELKKCALEISQELGYRKIKSD